MELFFTILFLLMLLLCAIGAVYFFYRAIRLFFNRKLWGGAVRLLLSLLLGFIVFFVISAIIGAREKALQCSCSSHLKLIMLSMKMYAADHQEEYPITFNDMVGANYLRLGDKAVLICPATGHAAGSLTNIHDWTDYAYVSGLSEADPAGCVVAYCLPENHKGEGASVAFIGGNVQWYSCTPYKDSTGQYQPTFQELTNTPSLFCGTANEVKLAELKKRTRIICPEHHK